MAAMIFYIRIVSGSNTRTTAKFEWITDIEVSVKEMYYGHFKLNHSTNIYPFIYKQGFQEWKKL